MNAKDTTDQADDTCLPLAHAVNRLVKTWHRVKGPWTTRTEPNSIPNCISNGIAAEYYMPPMKDKDTNNQDETWRL
jgi:hypothetical protein